MESSHMVVMVLSAQVQRQTNKTASEVLSSLKFKSLPSLKLFNKPITTLRLIQKLEFTKGNNQRDIDIKNKIYINNSII